MGTCVDVEECDVMDSGAVASITTKLNLLGFKSADIVITGGGVGPKATPFVFQLENEKF